MQWSSFGWLNFIEDSHGVHSIGYENGLIEMSGPVSKNLTVWREDAVEIYLKHYLEARFLILPMVSMQ